MGKPYAFELEQLTNTYMAAMSIDIDNLANAILNAGSLPLVIVGSGGSLTAAHFVASLHQRFAQTLARVVTPLELIESDLLTRDLVVWCLSAGGSNSDIKEVFQIVAQREPQHLLAVCAKTGSPLSRLANRYHYTECFDFDLPSQRDGFLATNSLLAFYILFARAYQTAFGMKESLPENLTGILHPAKSVIQFYDELKNNCLPLWRRNCLTVLYGVSAKSAAIDLESKFTEAALGAINLSDFRNFAHGRHHWLAKRGEDTAVLAITTDIEEDLARRTLEHLPANIPVVELHCSGNSMVAAIKALVVGLYVVSLAGEAKGIDPGRPGVPQFGRDLYNLRIKDTQLMKANREIDSLTIAAIRKAKALPEVLKARGEFDFWVDACKKFIQNLESTEFSSIVFDYDGTLCAPCERFGGIRNSIGKEITNLLRAGITLGIATGRGKSVRDSLRQSVPRKYWRQVLVGYYNGADCGFLDEDYCPNGSSEPCSELVSVAKALCDNPQITRLASITIRKAQITIEPKAFVLSLTVWQLVSEIVHSLNLLGLRVVRSSHSIDVLAPSVSKLTVVNKLQSKFWSLLNNPSAEVLCIGDKGCWPGNDCELLSQTFSLSVDEVSSDPMSCWNLAPAGYRGVQATLKYLSCIQLVSGGFKLNLETLRGL